MISVLNAILCWIKAVANMALWAIMSGVNLIIQGIADGVAAVIVFLPNMPTPPDWTGVTSDVFGYANWVFPVGLLVTTIAAIGVLWVGWQVVSWVLRFVRATA